MICSQGISTNDLAMFLHQAILEILVVRSYSFSAKTCRYPQGKFSTRSGGRLDEANVQTSGCVSSTLHNYQGYLIFQGKLVSWNILALKPSNTLAKGSVSHVPSIYEFLPFKN